MQPGLGVYAAGLGVYAAGLGVYAYPYFLFDRWVKFCQPQVNINVQMH